MAKKQLKVKLENGIALEVRRAAVKKRKLVYVLLANKKLKYERGYSHILYIGTTTKGVRRIASSAAAKAAAMLGEHGVKSVSARIITCEGRSNVKSWKKLERALIIKFSELHREPPFYNKQGIRMQRRDEFEYFSESKIHKILKDLDG